MRKVNIMALAIGVFLVFALTGCDNEGTKKGAEVKKTAIEASVLLCGKNTPANKAKFIGAIVDYNSAYASMTLYGKSRSVAPYDLAKATAGTCDTTQKVVKSLPSLYLSPGK